MAPMNNDRLPLATAIGRSLVVPSALALAAPLVVIIGIEALRNVWWVFVIYQVGICLVAPAVESRLAGRGWREHAALLGLRESRGRTLAAVLGLVTALATGAFLLLTRDRFLDPDRLDATVAGWGVDPVHMVAMLAVMAVLNATAEELFWRGYLPGRVAASLPGHRPPVFLTVVLPAMLYASYHAVTIGRLVGQTVGVIVMTGGVLAAGLSWGWLRQRTGSVWPPLLSHGGAVIAYLAVHYWLVGVGTD